MSGIKVEIKGLDEAIRRLDVKKLEKPITDVMKAFGRDVARDAKDNLSLHGTTDMGALTNSIDTQSLVPLEVEIFAHKDYAAYVEFGTGPFAAIYVPSIEPEWQAIARRFYVNGKGRMPAQPYLHPAFYKNYPALIDDLEDLLTNPPK